MVEAKLNEHFKNNSSSLKRQIFKVVDAAIGKQMKWQGDIRYNLSSHAQAKIDDLSIWRELKMDEIKEEEIRRKLWKQDLWLN